MLQEILFNQRPDIALSKMLDKGALNQRVIAANIANVETPGYMKRGILFEDELAKAVRAGKTPLLTSDPRHLPDRDAILKITPEVVQVDDGYWNGINNVNIEEEMVALSENQLDFTIASRIVSMRFDQLRTAIRGSR